MVAAAATNRIVLSRVEQVCSGGRSYAQTGKENEKRERERELTRLQ